MVQKFDRTHFCVGDAMAAFAHHILTPVPAHVIDLRYRRVLNLAFNRIAGLVDVTLGYLSDAPELTDAELTPLIESVLILSSYEFGDCYHRYTTKRLLLPGAKQSELLVIKIAKQLSPSPGQSDNGINVSALFRRSERMLSDIVLSETVMDAFRLVFDGYGGSGNQSRSSSQPPLPPPTAKIVRTPSHVTGMTPDRLTQHLVDVNYNENIDSPLLWKQLVTNAEAAATGDSLPPESKAAGIAQAAALSFPGASRYTKKQQKLPQWRGSTSAGTGKVPAATDDLHSVPTFEVHPFILNRQLWTIAFYKFVKLEPSDESLRHVAMPPELTPFCRSFESVWHQFKTIAGETRLSWIFHRGSAEVEVRFRPQNVPPPRAIAPTDAFKPEPVAGAVAVRDQTGNVIAIHPTPPSQPDSDSKQPAAAVPVATAPVSNPPAPPKPIVRTLAVSVPQLLILLVFNRHIQITVSELLSETKFELSAITPALVGLIVDGVVIKQPAAQRFLDDDRLWLSPTGPTAVAGTPVTSKRQVIPIREVKVRMGKPDLTEKTSRAIAHRIDALIVRVMKARMSSKIPSLLSELRPQLKDILSMHK